MPRLQSFRLVVLLLGIVLAFSTPGSQATTLDSQSTSRLVFCHFMYWASLLESPRRQSLLGQDSAYYLSN